MKLNISPSLVFGLSLIQTLSFASPIAQSLAKGETSSDETSLGSAALPNGIGVKNPLTSQKVSTTTDDSIPGLFSGQSPRQYDYSKYSNGYQSNTAQDAQESLDSLNDKVDKSIDIANKNLALDITFAAVLGTGAVGAGAYLAYRYGPKLLARFNKERGEAADSQAPPKPDFMTRLRQKYGNARVDAAAKQAQANLKADGLDQRSKWEQFLSKFIRSPSPPGEQASPEAPEVVEARQRLTSAGQSYREARRSQLTMTAELHNAELDHSKAEEKFAAVSSGNPTSRKYKNAKAAVESAAKRVSAATDALPSLEATVNEKSEQAYRARLIVEQAIIATRNTVNEGTASRPESAGGKSSDDTKANQVEPQRAEGSTSNPETVVRSSSNNPVADDWLAISRTRGVISPKGL